MGPADALRPRGPAATAYFELHVERDVEHALAGRALIEERLDCSGLPRSGIGAGPMQTLRGIRRGQDTYG